MKVKLNKTDYKKYAIKKCNEIKKKQSSVEVLY